MRPLSLDRERVSALILTCALWVLAVPIFAAVRNQVGGYPTWWTAVMLVSLLGCAAASFAHFLRGTDPAPVARVLVVVVSGGLLSLVWVPHELVGETSWLAALVPTAAGACALVSHRLRVVLAMGFLVVGAQTLHEVTGVGVRNVSAFRAAADTLYSIAVLAIVVVVVLAARVAHECLTKEQEHAISTFADARIMEGSLRAATRWDALVHDEVLAALALIASADTAQAQVAASRAIERVGGAMAGAYVPLLREALLEATIETYPLAITDMRLHATAEEPPAVVVSALADACAAALRNVERHAYSPSAPGPASVRLWQSNSGARVQIQDYGRGFDPHAVRPQALGIVVAIEQRLASVGGRATVVSSPGAGTVVELTWPDDHR